ncbi:multidrug effflux MFS transporter [uncultured Schumannella sp.]|uniref:multidrug effflux MFS transporter n=1 Tax=uncultured Schumannella sp. TaxID=1195956 RepID=UPI0025DBA326|nr:multidrug effflux MFS transporter [uncultured Schumannella sp.]
MSSEIRVEAHPPTKPIVLHPGDSLTKGQRLVYVLVLGALVALGPFTIDLYLPAFPAIATVFDATDAAIQLTLTATTIGFGLGQLLIGPWSDKVGRRTPLLVATALHIAASLGVALAPDLGLIGLFRVLQGIGAAGGGVVAMAMVRDLFGGHPLVRMLARLALVTGLAPIVAPVIGSQLLQIMDWRGIFWVLMAYGIAVLVLAWFLIIETLPPARRRDVGHSTARDRYRALFHDRVFVGIAIVGAMNFSSLFAYLAASSFLFQDVYGLDAQQYGLVFGANSLGLVICSQLSSRVMRRVGPQWVIAVTLTGMFLAAASIVVFSIAGGGIWTVLIPLFVLISLAGATFPAIQVTALAHHGKEAGTAASLLGAVNFGLAGLISPIVGWLGIGSALPMAAVQMATLAVAIIVLWVVVRPRTVPSIAGT